MPTSELSDALNPHAAHSRPRIHAANSAQTSTPTSTPTLSNQSSPQLRSELEHAISEPVPQPSRVRLNPSSGALTAVQELVALVASTRQAHDLERTRRLAWEQEQEAKYVQRQVEMESKLLEMRNEISQLRAHLSPNRSPLFSVAVEVPPTIPTRPRIQSQIQQSSPVSPHAMSSHPAQFVQGSSRQHLLGNATHSPSATASPNYPSPLSFEPVTPDLPPMLATLSSSTHHTQEHRPRGRKRSRAECSSEDDRDAGSSSSRSRSRPRRLDHRDKRILTIHRAMREHFLLLMEMADDKNLPDGHQEGDHLEPSDPVRFVWDKTSKQSAHNGRMKARITDDIRERRRMYKHVPEREFNKKVVDAAFEQAFTTFRQKFRAQRDVDAAMRLKDREDAKARKARHLHRRNTKLSNRANARLKLNDFHDTTYDAAMQVECMSSEESDFDGDPGGPRSSGPLTARGYAWRSARLLRFYELLDAEDAADAENRPKRGAGRRERYTGPHKEDSPLPPKGIARWMISKHWLANTRESNADIDDVLKSLVSDDREIETDVLGVDSDEERDEGGVRPTVGNSPETIAEPSELRQQAPPPNHFSTSSLSSALV